MSEIFLALDCSNRLTCLALAEDGSCMGEKNLNLGRSQAARLPGCVESLAGEAGITLSRIDWISLVVGPGYFTGVRIALAYGLALAVGLDIPVVPVSSLEALAQSARPRPGEMVVPCIRAGEGSVYCSGFMQKENYLVNKIPEGERSFDELWSLLRDVACPFRIAATEDRTCCKMGCDKFLDRLFCIGGWALTQVAWAHRSEAIHPKEVRARYYRSPGIQPSRGGTASLGGEFIGEGV